MDSGFWKKILGNNEKEYGKFRKGMFSFFILLRWLLEGSDCLFNNFLYGFKVEEERL